MKTINREKFKELFIKAEQGDRESQLAVVEVLRPEKGESVDEILDKIKYFIRIFFISSLKYKDSPFHNDIDIKYAEQVHSIINYGRPKYKGLIIYGYRESAKTARVMFCESYLACYVPEFQDSVSVVSEDGGKADEFNMGMFNILAFSTLQKYFGNIIALDLRKSKKKESQTMSKFSTTTGVTFSSSAARKSKRGAMKVDVSDTGDVETKRPTKVIFDDIENEITLLSLAETEKIRKVMQSSIDGMNQTKGSWILLGNYLSLRGNVAHFLNKYHDDPNVAIIDIPIKDYQGQPTWPDKYCLTDSEQKELFDQGINKVSIQSIERDSDNFETEFMNNPRRSLVYFDDRAIAGFSDENLLPESARDSDGYLEIDAPELHATYVISVDSAKGVGKDESAFTVIKTDGARYEEVASFRSKTIKPENYAGYVANKARYYNNALIIPENNYPGNEFIAFLRDVYHNIYTEGIDDKKEWGINTNVKTKPEMLLKAKQIFIAKLFTVKSRALFNQIIEYPSTEVYTLKQRDGEGGHFDLFMSCVIGLWKINTISAEYKDNDRINEVIKRINRDTYDESESHSW